ncbi:MAG: ABC transporter permease, partial [Actinomycetota bacterium]|nr:ABC transporter permease [Actinomycetota bacterium]
VQVRKLARRSIARTLRQPVLFVPGLVFPLFMLWVISGVGDQVTEIKGFPTDSYVSFVLGAMMVQAAAGATTGAGSALGTDLETGFFSRLVLTPMRGSAVIAAQLAGVVLTGTLQATLLLLAGLAIGASVETGVVGALVILAFVLVMLLAFGSIGLLIAVKTGSAEQVHGLFSISLALIFMSSMSMPRDLMKEEWFETIATYNPMSYLIEAPRSLFISGWDSEALALGGGIAAVVLIVSLTASATALSRKSPAR